MTRRGQTAIGVLAVAMLGGRTAIAQSGQRPAIPAPAVPAQAPEPVPLVLRGVTVLDVRTGRHLPDRTVVVVGTRIRTMGRTRQVRVPRAAHVVNARGKYLIPGLWDLHVHTKEFADVAYPLFIANGVTGVRDAGSNVPLTTLVQWKRDIAEGRRVGPRLLVSGPIIEGRAPADPADTVNVVQGTGRTAHRISVPLAAVRRVVDSLHAAGADMLKIYGPGRDIHLALMAEAKRLGMRFGGHASDDLLGLEFSDSGALLLDHAAWLDPQRCGENAADEAPLATFDGRQCAAAIRRLWQNHTWITVMAGFSLFERQAARSLRYLPDSQLYAEARRVIQQHPVIQGDTARLAALAAAQEQTSGAAWEELFTASATAYNAWLASDHGRPLADSLRHYQVRLPIVIGTDAAFGAPPWPLPGFAVHDLLLLLARPRLPAGLAAYMQPTLLGALQTATLNPALALQATDSLGTVEQGKLADLVLLDADPLQDIWNTTKIRAVIANGRYYDRAALDALLQAAHEAAVAARAHAGRP